MKMADVEKDESTQEENNMIRQYLEAVEKRGHSGKKAKIAKSSFLGAFPEEDTHYLSESTTYKRGMSSDSQKSWDVRSLSHNESSSFTVYRNGCVHGGVRISARSVEELLDQSTSKLSLPSAARKIFNHDATPVHHLSDVTDAQKLYVTCGEKCKKVEADVRHCIEAKHSTCWTLQGLVWKEGRHGNNHNKYCKMSRRMRNLLSSGKKRYLVFRNGSGSQSLEVVVHPDEMQELLSLATEKLSLKSPGKKLFDWSGRVVHHLKHVAVLDECLQRKTANQVLGPVWLSRGEGFNPEGVLVFLNELVRYVSAKLLRAEDYTFQLKCSQLGEEFKDKVSISDILSMTSVQVHRQVDEMEGVVARFTHVLDTLQKQQRKLHAMLSSDLCKDSKAPQKFSADPKLLGHKGLKLRVLQSEGSRREHVVYFNMNQALKAVEPASSPSSSKHLDDQLMSLLLRRIEESLSSGRGHVRVGRHIYTPEGKVVKRLGELQYDQTVLLSRAEDRAVQGRPVSSSLYKPQCTMIQLFLLKNGETNHKRVVKVHCEKQAGSFVQFLDLCTVKLNLPLPAMRLFSQSGVELKRLDDLHSDQLVYVSTGDAWMDGRKTALKGQQNHSQLQQLHDRQEERENQQKELKNQQEKQDILQDPLENILEQKCAQQPPLELSQGVLQKQDNVTNDTTPSCILEPSTQKSGDDGDEVSKKGEDWMDVVTNGMDVVTNGMDVVTNGMDVVTNGMDVVTNRMDVETNRMDVVTNGMGFGTDEVSVGTDGVVDAVDQIVAVSASVENDKDDENSQEQHQQLQPFVVIPHHPTQQQGIEHLSTEPLQQDDNSSDNTTNQNNNSSHNTTSKDETRTSKSARKDGRKVTFQSDRGRLHQGRRVVAVEGGSVQAILKDCASKHQLSEAPKYLYTHEGKLVSDVSEIAVGQKLCASSSLKG